MGVENLRSSATRRTMPAEVVARARREQTCDGSRRSGGDGPRRTTRNHTNHEGNGSSRVPSASRVVPPSEAIRTCSQTFHIVMITFAFPCSRSFVEPGSEQTRARTFFMATQPNTGRRSRPRPCGSLLAMHRDKMLHVSREATRRREVRRISEERASEGRGHGAQCDEPEEAQRSPVRALHRILNSRRIDMLWPRMLSRAFRSPPAPVRSGTMRPKKRMGSTGFEPVTFAMSRRCHSH